MKLTGNTDQLVMEVTSYLYDQPAGIYQVEIKPFRTKRSLSQNALMWDWFTLMGKFFSTPKKQFTKENMHDLMCHKFLGYEDIEIGGTIIKDQLITTSKLNSSEMFHFMEQVEAWCVEHGLFLPIPGFSDYAKTKKKIMEAA